MYFVFGVRDISRYIYIYKQFFNNIIFMLSENYEYCTIVNNDSDYVGYAKNTKLQDLGIFNNYNKARLAYIQACECIVQDLVDKKDFVNKWYYTNKNAEITKNKTVELVVYSYIQSIVAQYRCHEFVYVANTKDIIIRKRVEENKKDIIDIEIKYNPYNENIVDDILNHTATEWSCTEKNVKELKNFIINKVNNYFDDNIKGK